MMARVAIVTSASSAAMSTEMPTTVEGIRQRLIDVAHEIEEHETAVWLLQREREELRTALASRLRSHGA
jgi:hypothetical protein